MEQNLRFLLVLGWLAVLKTAKPNLSLATFEDKWRDGVHRNEIFEEIIPDFSTFSNFKKNIYIKAILCNFSIEKLPSKVAHNPTRPPVFSPASFCYVKLRQF